MTGRARGGVRCCEWLFGYRRRDSSSRCDGSHSRSGGKYWSFKCICYMTLVGEWILQSSFSVLGDFITLCAGRYGDVKTYVVICYICFECSSSIDMRVCRLLICSFRSHFVLLAACIVRSALSITSGRANTRMVFSKLTGWTKSGPLYVDVLPLSRCLISVGFAESRRLGSSS